VFYKTSNFTPFCLETNERYMKRSSYVILAVCFQCLTSIQLSSAHLVDTLRTEESPAVDTTHVNPYKIGAIVGVGATAFVIGHVLVNDFWWKGEKSEFHVNWEQDWKYSLGADKLGHMYFAYASATALGGAFRWAGMDSATSIWTGAGIALGYQTYVEVRDGFSAGYGFSPGDVIFNTVGASIPVLQHYIPALRSLELQISYYPSEKFRQGGYGSIIDDYESTTHWYSLSVYDIVPRTWQQWYPPWLNLALGHSVQGLDGNGGGQHILYLSLDWNLQRIEGIPSWLKDVFRYLHMYHLPAPAVRILPNVVWYGLRF
jgi:hypothetical protein